MQSPYLEIVEDIKRRVAEGKLKPGDRLPPVRQVAKRWGVALATATKAMNTLQQQGIVQAKPRVGTVVAVPGRTPEPSAELTREAVVRAAIEIADAEGLGALTMRGVAGKLGVAPMSPYKHVESKEDLILLMADTVYGSLTYPEKRPDGWRAGLEEVARTMWTLHRRHSWLGLITSLNRPVALPNLAVHADRVLGALERLGLDPVTTLTLHVLFYSYVQGLAVNLEREAQAEEASGMSEEEWMDLQEPRLAELVATGAYPAYARVLEGLTDGYDLDLDEVFELGLRLQLDGLAAMIESGRSV
ncbi:TetR/AcrR family transcriptional regulator C-terminal domain-containing protein [Nonomuraea sp. NPDC059194]|uniref:TetR/AcrR family transcriptional regulator C-terminal domain-containing protein n=1 Tax=Nonomuraea sp. NPDC059194 TaxID=3346764 RepID=UPI003698BBCF